MCAFDVVRGVLAIYLVHILLAEGTYIAAKPLNVYHLLVEKKEGCKRP